MQAEVVYLPGWRHALYQLQDSKVFSQMRASRGSTMTVALLVILAFPSLAVAEECAVEVAATSGKALLQAKSVKKSYTVFHPGQGLRQVNESSIVGADATKAPSKGRPKAEDVVVGMMQTWAGWSRSAMPEEGSAELLGGRTAAVAISKFHTMPYICLFAFLLAVAAYAAFRQQLLTKLLERLNLVNGSEKGNLDNQVSLPADDSTFCQELVVPAGCECILLVPARPKRGQPFDITDTQGNAVLSVVDDTSQGKEGAGVQRRMLVADRTILAQCGRARSSLPGSMLTSVDFELLSSTGEVWAKLTYEPRQGAEDKCSIETKTGQRFFLLGSVRHNALNMSDSNGALIATTEPTTEPGPLGQPAGSLFKLRAAPLCDVGFILCSLLCLQHLSHS